MKTNLKWLDGEKGAGESGYKGTEGPFGSDEHIFYPDWGDAFMAVCIYEYIRGLSGISYLCQQLSNYAFQVSAFYCMSIVLQWSC